ncbi:prephenate dehydrogenase [Anaerococcus sp. WCA-380-WT-2B]|uniref:Prephenate dehydrogenase n=1 Tax=Anaerococcus porci TaxID=2652269 RepID=A0A6N7VG91_9FIRM|nr:prephenate dehydrogenase [Anaerococcus porci]MSS78468.1 prephenate dehydrogenase [Anaerococcus porci]
MKNIAIVGLGLMGGSFAKAFIKYTNNNIFVYDIDKKSLEDGKNFGIREILNLEDLSKMDLTIICLNPNIIMNFVKENHKYFKNTVMDIAGVKNEVYPLIKSFESEGSFIYKSIHPMAGREIYGFKSSIDDLYKDASMIYVDELNEEEVFLFKSIGFSKFVKASCEVHDKMISFTSQLCHVISNAYILNDKSLNYDGFAAGSLKDMTRVAKINEKLWSELFLENRKFLLEDIDILIDNLKNIKNCLIYNDRKSLEDILLKGSNIRKKMW